MADEVAQDAFYRALVHWPKVRGMDNPGGWLHTVAINLARRRLRRRAPAHLPLSPTAADIPGDVSRRVDLTAAIRRLPADQRTAVVVRHVLGYPTDQAARLLNRSPGATRALLHRALSALRADPELRLHDIEEPRL